MTYPNTQLFINGQWCDAEAGRTLAVFNPATGTEIGRLAHAGIPDLERAAQAAHKGFEIWRDTPANERSAVLRKAAALMRERANVPVSMLRNTSSGTELTSRLNHSTIFSSAVRGTPATARRLAAHARNASAMASSTITSGRSARSGFRSMAVSI